MEREKSDGSWEVSDSGELCVVVNSWGADKECHQYVKNDGAVELYYNGKARVAKITAGNTLSSL